MGELVEVHSIPIALTPPNLTLADLDRKNTHSFVLPLSRPSDQSTAMNIATQCLSQFARLFVHLVLPFCHSVCAYPFFSSLLSCPSGATVGPPMYWANTTHMIQGSTMTSTCQHIATLQCFNRRISYPESMSVGSGPLSKPIANIKHLSLGGVSVSFPISNVTVREVEYSNDCNLDSKT